MLVTDVGRITLSTTSVYPYLEVKPKYRMGDLVLKDKFIKPECVKVVDSKMHDDALIMTHRVVLTTTFYLNPD